MDLINAIITNIFKNLIGTIFHHFYRQCIKLKHDVTLITCYIFNNQILFTLLGIY